MKKFYFLWVLMFFTSLSFSQAWLKNLPQNKPKEKLTFFDYRNAFNEYWAPYNVDKGYYMDNGVQKKAVGWKQFKRWEYDMERQVNPSNGEFPLKTAQLVYDEYLKTNQPLQAATFSNWVNLGTSSSTGGYAGVGRVNCIAFHPSDVNTYWVGVAAGGLWVTTNNGSTWTCLTDNNNVLAVSDIVIPSDFSVSNTIYIATGDKDHWDNRSIGILKSTNGGSTWTSTGISFALSDNKMVNRLLLDPGNNQVLIAATTNGVYKTTNGGTTWNTQMTAYNFIDMEYKPGDFNTLYGSNQSGGIYVSSNGGTTWTQAFSDPSAYRIELAVSANQPTWVYALAANSASGLYGIYKSTNSGASFTQVFAGTTLNLLGWNSNGGDAGGQGWYDLSLAAAPSDANTVLVGGVNTWRSVNGGLSWAIVNHWSGSAVQAVHADKHKLLFRTNGDLFECNDGGTYISINNGTNWTDKTNGLVISQMYKLGVSATVANEVITGLQDNGTKLYSSNAWSDVKGGDGMECLIDYSNVIIQYGTYVYGQISRTTNHWASSTNIQPASAGNGAWVTPYIIDPVNPLTLYAGYADVWKTTDRGNNWTKISTMNSATYFIRSMAIAPSNTQYLYVADLYHIWKTINGGTSWTEITGTLPVGSGTLTYITVKTDDPNTLWVTMGGYNANTVYQSTDAGITWTNISTGLPQIPAYTIVQNKQSASTVQLYAGTELGVYFKNGTDNWVAYNTGLPNVKIGEIEIYYAANAQDSKLRAATFGRGLWETPVYYSNLPMTYVSSTATQNNTASAAPNQVNQEIIGVQILTDGSLTPLSATSFTFNTSGSTNPATDITNAKLFFTGGSSIFAATNQFGLTSTSPNGSFTIAGTQTLNGGTNYFWLAYDIPATAVLNNYLDAQCTSLTVGTVKTPTITNPAGNRLIAISYCSAGSGTCDEYISKVAIGTISNSTACSAGGYADYTAISTDILKGASLPVSVTNGVPYTLDQCGIWVDWNNNGNFLDDLTVTVTGTPGGGPYSATITCPSDATAGPKRMRVRIHYNDEVTSPCGISVYGEVEDYTINVTSPGGYAISGNILYNNPSNTPIDSMWVHLRSNNVIIDSVRTNLAGLYSFSNKSAGTYTVSERCKKPWGGVNATDAIKIKRHFAGLEVLTVPVRLQAADVNNTNSINATDAVKVERRFAGLDTTFARGNWTFAKPTGGDTVVVSTAGVTQDFQALCVGDVNGSYLPVTGSKSSTNLWLSSNAVQYGGAGEVVEVKLTIGADAGLGAFSIVLGYPSTRLTILSVSSSRENLVANIIAGQVRLAWSDLQPAMLRKGDAIVTLKILLNDGLDANDEAFFTLGAESELAGPEGDVLDGMELDLPRLKSIPGNTITGEPGLVSNLHIYPNPAKEQLTVRFDLGMAADVNLKLIDPPGQVFRSWAGRLEKGPAGRQIYLSDLPPGLYFLDIECRSAAGTFKTTQKIVKR